MSSPAPRGPGEDPAGPGEAMAPTSPTFLLGFALAGVVLGRLLRPVAERIDGTAPTVAWAQPLALGVVAGLLLVTARATRSSVREHRGPLAAYQAVNRLLLARACAVVGALVGGGYAGYAVAWLGSASPLADQRVVRSLVTVAVAAGMVGAALLLERACRVPPADPEP